MRASAPSSVAVSPLQAAQVYHERLLRHFGARLREVRLFGSCARGQATEDSDVDVFVLLRTAGWTDRRDALDLAGDVWRETGFFVSPLVMTEQLFETWLHQDRPLVRDIIREGLPL